MSVVTKVYRVRRSNFNVDVYRHMDWVATRLATGGLLVEWDARGADGKLYKMSHTYAPGKWLEAWSELES